MISSFALNSFIGCFADDGDRALDAFQGNGQGMAECVDQCASEGYLLSGSQWQGQCFCGNSFDESVQPASDACTCEEGATNFGGWANCVFTTLPEGPECAPAEECNMGTAVDADGDGCGQQDDYPEECGWQDTFCFEAYNECCACLEQELEGDDTEELTDLFYYIAQGDDTISNNDLLEFLTMISQEEPEELPLQMVPAIVEFAGFYTPVYNQCNLNYEMTLDEFIQAVSQYDSVDEDSNAESAIWFSIIDLENNCQINQYEVSFVLEFLFEVPPAEQMHILEWLGGYAGEDLQLSFDEFNAAINDASDAATNKLSKSQKMKENKAYVKKAFKLMRNEKFMAKKSMTKKSWSKKSLNKKMRSKKIFRKK